MWGGGEDGVDTGTNLSPGMLRADMSEVNIANNWVCEHQQLDGVSA